MKALAIILLAVAVPSSLLAAKQNFTAKTVMIPPGTYVCDSRYRAENLGTLQRAGDGDEVAVYVAKGYCAKSPAFLYVTALSDDSRIGKTGYVEFSAQGTSLWASQWDAFCCYRRAAQGGWERIGSDTDYDDDGPGSTKKMFGCMAALSSIRDLENEGLKDSALFKDWSDFYARNCE